MEKKETWDLSREEIEERLRTLKQEKPKRLVYYITQSQFEPYELRLMVDSIQSSKHGRSSVPTLSQG